MDIVELPVSEGLFQLAGALPRSSGVHVSDIIRDIENETTKPGQRKRVADLTENERRRMGAYIHGGFAWEEVLRGGVVKMYSAGADRLCSPGELERDGVYGTPDGFDVDSWCIEEMKCTWRSSRWDIVSDFWSWWVQIKAYCHMSYTDRARLWVFFVNGDYRDSGPQVKMYEAVFNAPELERNWTMLLTHARGKQWL